MSLLILLPPIFAILTWFRMFNTKKRLPLPPGPPGYPIIGNLFSLPSEYQEDMFCDLAKVYGDIFHLKVPGKNVIVLNSFETAQDLLQNRSAKHSDRPSFQIFDLVGWTPSLPFLRYGKTFHRHRQLLQGYLNRRACESHQIFQLKEARELVKNLESHPLDYEESLARYSTAIALFVAFGHKISSNDDIYLDIMKNVTRVQSHLGSPGSTLVEFLPFLKYMPSWFPGTYYVNYARNSRQVIRTLHEYPFEQVVKQMTGGGGVAFPSFLSHQLEELWEEGSKTEADIADVQGAAAVIYCAGSDTTWSALLIFVLAMVLHPECQLRAQEEIDTIVGSDRLPDFSDRLQLPYIEAILQESYRWNVVTPLAIPHQSLEDDTYKGMHLPKGSIFMPNVKAMSIDENIYSDPRTFNPMRFFPSPAGNDEPYLSAQFGFGRRKCPGRYLADASLWIAIVTIVATLDIQKAKDKNGDEITPEPKMTSGISRHPIPFQCSIVARSRDSAT